MELGCTFQMSRVKFLPSTLVYLSKQAFNSNSALNDVANLCKDECEIVSADNTLAVERSYMIKNTVVQH